VPQCFFLMATPVTDHEQTDVNFVAAIDSAVDLAIVEDSQYERVRDVGVGTLRPACHVAVDDSVLYRHSQRLDTHYLTCNPTSDDVSPVSTKYATVRLEIRTRSLQMKSNPD